MIYVLQEKSDLESSREAGMSALAFWIKFEFLPKFELDFLSGLEELNLLTNVTS